MYTIDCEDPNCVECIQASKGQCSEEENQNKIQMTVEELVSKKLLLAHKKKELCAERCRRVKDEIHFRIGVLIGILREREQHLYSRVDRECCNQMIKLDKDATTQCIHKLLKKSHEPETAVSGSKLVFNSEFNSIKSELRRFGQVSWEHYSELKNRIDAKKYQKVVQQLKEYTGKPFDNAALSTVPLDSPFEAISIAEMENRGQEMVGKLFNDDQLDFPLEGTDSVSSKEVGKDSSLNQGQEMVEKLFNDDWLDFSLKSTDSVSRKEIGKFPTGIEKLKNALEILSKSMKNEGQYFEDGTNSVCRKEVGKDSSSNQGQEMVEKLFNDDWLDFSLKSTDSVSHKEIGKVSSLFPTGIEKLKNALEYLTKSMKNEGQYFEDGTNSVCRKEVGKDSSSDEDDMEIISKSEAATIPSEMPPLPPKNRFRFGKKRSCFPSLYLKKPLLSPENNLAYEVPIYSETKSQNSLEARRSLGLPDVEKLLSFNEQAGQASSRKCPAKPESSVSKDIKKTDLILSVAEKKEIPSFNEQSSQECSSECLEDSNAEGQGHDPSVALLSSFKKYLEKNPEDEWLVPGNCSEQSLSSGNSCIFNRPNPFLVGNLDQWLSTKSKEKVVSDWLYTAAM